MPSDVFLTQVCQEWNLAGFQGCKGIEFLFFAVISFCFTSLCSIFSWEEPSKEISDRVFGFTFTFAFAFNFAFSFSFFVLLNWCEDCKRVKDVILQLAMSFNTLRHLCIEQVLEKHFALGWN